MRLSMTALPARIGSGSIIEPLYAKAGGYNTLWGYAMLSIGQACSQWYKSMVL